MAQSEGGIDRLLDRAVAPGFSRIGWALRSRSFDPLPDARGRQVVITGASAGLGRSAARMIAAAGASVTMVSRDRDRAAAAIAEVQEAANGGGVRFEAADMSDLASVAELADRLLETHPRIDALVLNAGVLLDRRELTDDGIELAWATNVVGPFLLEQLLMPALQAARGRVVMVTSGGAYSEHLELPAFDADDSVPYKGSSVYARTKRAQIVLAELQTEQLAETGVTVHAVHPGWADTPGVKSSLPTFRALTAPLLRTADQGADSIAWVALADDPVVSPGLLWHDRAPRPRHRMARTHETPVERLELDEDLRRICRLGKGQGGRG